MALQCMISREFSRPIRLRSFGQCSLGVEVVGEHFLRNRSNNTSFFTHQGAQGLVCPTKLSPNRFYSETKHH